MRKKWKSLLFLGEPHLVSNAGHLFSSWLGEREKLPGRAERYVEKRGPVCVPCAVNLFVPRMFAVVPLELNFIGKNVV